MLLWWGVGESTVKWFWVGCGEGELRREVEAGSMGPLVGWVYLCTYVCLCVWRDYLQ